LLLKEGNAAVPNRRRALVYGDVNLNIIDGSAIWVQSVVDTLVGADCDVTLLLKAPVHTDRLLDPMRRLGIRIVQPFEEGRVALPTERLAPGDAVGIMTELDVTEPFDLVLIRGLNLAESIAASGHFDGRLWTYLTDIPQSVESFDTRAALRLDHIARASRYLLCQTEELRCFLESLIPAACGRSVLFPPVVPRFAFELRRPDLHIHHPLRLVYTGKFAPRWNTFEMTRLPHLLEDRGIAAELHMIGDKIHDDRDDPEFSGRMRSALGTSAGVIWHGGMSRKRAMELTAATDIGLSWRHPSLDASLELSTKVLEYGALGLPVVLNRTRMHESILGVDYPLFVNDGSEVLDVIIRAADDPAVWRLASDRCRAAAGRARLDVAVRRMSSYLRRAFPGRAETSGPAVRRLRVGVAGHDFKFFTRVLDQLRGLDNVDLDIDDWPTITSHDTSRSRALVEWADVVIVEWCGPAAVWYSRHKRRGQRLIVRLHRFELYRPWPSEVDIDNVDQVICVSPYYARLAREKTTWPSDKIAVVPNWVDVDQFDRPKLEAAQFNLGFIGIAPMRKRLDLALDILETLRRHDERYTLIVKSKMTWDYRWIWKDLAERRHVDEILHRVHSSPLLRSAVIFDEFGPDVATWLRRVGFVLSTSDDESFHMAPAEGMASGAVPMLLHWPGADLIYESRWIFDSPHELADRILQIVISGSWEDERRYAQDRVRQCFDLEAVCRAWTDLLVRNRPGGSTSGSLMPTQVVAQNRA
jgi:glycosyltransferase involved in cell wall biosynthesis